MLSRISQVKLKKVQLDLSRETSLSDFCACRTESASAFELVFVCFSSQRENRCKNSEDFYNLMEEANMEEYYESIEKFTFPSIFSPLSPDTAQAIVVLCLLLNFSLI